MDSICFQTLSDKFNFGKFEGCSLGEVMSVNPSYIRWIVNNVCGKMCAIDQNAIDEIRKVFPDFIMDEDFMLLAESRIMEFYNDDCYVAECDDEGNTFYEHDTYENYNGSYAQDVMGYSDDEIDIVFDGDPDAYWNID